tara:strand:- start:1028 stop:1243 length:216 start_codon:yes stop_codon:yes gene_type:complete
MKVRLFMDVWPQAEIKYMSATASPGVKSPNTRRFSFYVEIPDDAIYGEHEDATDVGGMKEVKNTARLEKGK